MYAKLCGNLGVDDRSRTMFMPTQLKHSLMDFASAHSRPIIDQLQLQAMVGCSAIRHSVIELQRCISVAGASLFI